MERRLQRGFMCAKADREYPTNAAQLLGRS